MKSHIRLQSRTRTWPLMLEFAFRRSNQNGNTHHITTTQKRPSSSITEVSSLMRRRHPIYFIISAIRVPSCLILLLCNHILDDGILEWTSDIDWLMPGFDSVDRLFPFGRKRTHPCHWSVILRRSHKSHPCPIHHMLQYIITAKQINHYEQT